MQLRQIISENEIKDKITALANKISKDNKYLKEIIVVCVLKGAMLFCSDLIRAIHKADGPNLILETLNAKSYQCKESSGKVQITGSFDCKDKNILIVEDILDTGRTLSAIKSELIAKGARTIKICVLLDKPARRKIEINADYTGFIIEDHFVVGYGLDICQKGRELPFIAVATNKEEISQIP